MNVHNATITRQTTQRTKTVFSNHEVVHVWASQRQQYGKNSKGSIFFDGPSIYSYGHHFEMARIIKPGVVFINPDSYSNTTSKHQSYTRQAVSHLKQFKVAYFSDLPRSVTTMIADIQNAALRAKRARQNKGWAIEALDEAIEHLKGFVAEFPKAITKDNRKAYQAVISDTGLEALVAQKEEVERQVRADEKAKLARRIKQQAENLALWIKGEPSNGAYRFDEMRLRVKGDEVETTHGASVPVREARMLYKAIKAGRNVIGQRVGYYTVNSVTPELLTVGCHRIPMSEIERISAAVLAWTKAVCPDCESEEHTPNCASLVSQ